jgi:hypothetical protein
MTQIKWFEEMSAFIDRNLGRCSRCIRTSFLAAAGGWIALLITYQLALDRALFVVGIFVAALTALWVAHLVAYATRRSVRLFRNANLGIGTVDAIDQGRRSVFPTFARAFVGMAVVTAIPGLAHAESCEVTCKDGTHASKSCDAGHTCKCYCIDHAECNCY